MQFVFNERKAAQAAALLLERAGGSMPYIKLMKLLYLADRRALIESGYPITGDKMVSMDHGPVLSRVLDLITWGEPSGSTPWREYVSEPEHYAVTLTGAKDRDELSEYEEDVLQDVFTQFGAMGKWALVELTHGFPEWVDPRGSSVEIDIRVILRDAGISDEEIRAIAAQVEAVRSLERLNVLAR